MFNFNNYENFFKPFFKTDAFKAEDFYKNFSAAQNSFYEQVEKYTKIAEENNQKAVKYFEDHMKGFDKNAFVNQLEKFAKAAEENNQKAKKYFEEHAKMLDKDALMAQFKQFVSIAEENHQKAVKYIEQHNKFMNKEVMMDQFEKFGKIAEENHQKAVKYFEEQYQFWVKFQEELVSGMKSEESAKAVPAAIKNYSKAIANSNMKNIDESIKAVKEVIAK